VTVNVGSKAVPFSKETTRWLGVWLDSQLTLKGHHAVRMKEGRKAKARLHRLTGQMGLSPANCRKDMTACIQSAAMFGSELWWKGDHVTGTKGRAEELQLLVNQEPRDNRLLPDNQSGSPLDRVGPQGSDNKAGEQTAAVWATITEPATERPGTGGGRSPNGYRTAA